MGSPSEKGSEVGRPSLVRRRDASTPLAAVRALGVMRQDVVVVGFRGMLCREGREDGRVGNLNRVDKEDAVFVRDKVVCDDADERPQTPRRRQE